jgi:hypothetical protein
MILLNLLCKIPKLNVIQKLNFNYAKIYFTGYYIHNYKGFFSSRITLNYNLAGYQYKTVMQHKICLKAPLTITEKNAFLTLIYIGLHIYILKLIGTLKYSAEFLA